MKIEYLSGDPREDMALRLCSLAARGLWAEILCAMQLSPQPGVLLTPTGAVPTDDGISCLLSVALSDPDVMGLVVELLGTGRIDRRDDGALVCQRLVDAEARHQQKLAAASKGGRATADRRKGIAPPQEPAEELTELERLCFEVAGSSHWVAEWRVQEYPDDWIRRALIITQSGGIRSHKYAAGILKRWWKGGGPPDDAPGVLGGGDGYAV